MIRASELGGRAVVDLEAAEKLGRIDKVILNPETRRVAGFVVTRGGSLLRQGTNVVVPASAVHAVGPDAVTVHHSALEGTDPALDGLPRTSEIVGRKVVSTAGQLLGVIDDVLIDGADGRIVGYALTGADAASTLGRAFGKREGHTAVLRADVPLRTGRDLVVAPADAVHAADAAESGAHEPPATSTTPQTTAPGFPYATSWFQRGDDEGDAPETGAR